MPFHIPLLQVVTFLSTILNVLACFKCRHQQFNWMSVQRWFHLYILVSLSPLSINWKIILSQVATVSCLDALVSLLYTPSFWFIWSILLHTLTPSTNYWECPGLSDLVSGKGICSSSSPKYSHSCMAEPWACDTAQSTPAASHHHHGLGQAISPPVLFMEINEAHSAFPIPLSHHHASCFPPQDPAIPTQSKIKAGGPSQDNPSTPNPVGFQGMLELLWYGILRNACSIQESSVSFLPVDIILIENKKSPSSQHKKGYKRASS